MIFRSLTKTALGLAKSKGMARFPAFYFSQQNNFNQNQYQNNYVQENYKTSHVVANNVGLSKFLNRYRIYDSEP